MSDVTDKVIALSKPYLGPAAESFISRQCKSHLKIEMAALTSAHLKDLATWIYVGASTIMDPGKAAELAKKIAAT